MKGIFLYALAFVSLFANPSHIVLQQAFAGEQQLKLTESDKIFNEQVSRIYRSLEAPTLCLKLVERGFPPDENTFFLSRSDFYFKGGDQAAAAIFLLWACLPLIDHHKFIEAQDLTEKGLAVESKLGDLEQTAFIRGLGELFLRSNQQTNVTNKEERQRFLSFIEQNMRRLVRLSKKKTPAVELEQLDELLGMTTASESSQMIGEIKSRIAVLSAVKQKEADLFKVLTTEYRERETTALASKQYALANAIAEQALAKFQNAFGGDSVKLLPELCTCLRCSFQDKSELKTNVLLKRIERTIDQYTPWRGAREQVPDSQTGAGAIGDALSEAPNEIFYDGLLKSQFKFAIKTCSYKLTGAQLLRIRKHLLEKGRRDESIELTNLTADFLDTTFIPTGSVSQSTEAQNLRRNY